LPSTELISTKVNRIILESGIFYNFPFYQILELNSLEFESFIVNIKHAGTEMKRVLHNENQKTLEYEDDFKTQVMTLDGPGNTAIVYCFL